MNKAQRRIRMQFALVAFFAVIAGIVLDYAGFPLHWWGTALVLIGIFLGVRYGHTYGKKLGIFDSGPSKSIVKQLGRKNLPVHDLETGLGHIARKRVASLVAFHRPSMQAGAIFVERGNYKLRIPQFALCVRVYQPEHDPADFIARFALDTLSTSQPELYSAGDACNLGDVTVLVAADPEEALSLVRYLGRGGLDALDKLMGKQEGVLGEAGLVLHRGDAIDGALAAMPNEAGAND